jgi:hypothetical protein
MRGKIRLIVGALVLGLTLTACTTIDFVQNPNNRPEPMGWTETGEIRYRYYAHADAIYPIDSPRAERIRIERLEQWLSENDHAGAPYTIVSRQPIRRARGMIADAYDIYYDVVVHRPAAGAATAEPPRP